MDRWLENKTWNDILASVHENESHYRGTGLLHPFDGVTDPIDSAEGRKQGKYT